MHLVDKPFFKREREEREWAGELGGRGSGRESQADCGLNVEPTEGFDLRTHENMT